MDEETREKNNRRNMERALEIALGCFLTVGCAWYIVSFYAVVLLNYIFFTVMVIMYAIIPIRSLLSEDIAKTVWSFCHLFCYAPYVQFFLFYLASSVSTIVEMIPAFIEMLLTGKLVRLVLQVMRQRFGHKLYGSGEGFGIGRLCITSFICIALFLATAVLLFLGVAKIGKMDIRAWFIWGIGILFYCAFLLEVALILCCVYEDWFRVVFFFVPPFKSHTKWCLTRKLRKPLNWIMKMHLKRVEIQNRGCSQEIKELRETIEDQLEVIAGNVPCRRADVEISDSSSPLEFPDQIRETTSIDELNLSKSGSKDSLGESGRDSLRCSRSGQSRKARVQQKRLATMFLSVLFPVSYTRLERVSGELYDIYQESIWRRLSLWLLTALNAYLLWYDLWDLLRVGAFNWYFFIGMGLRLLFMPACSYFHVGIIFMEPKRWGRKSGKSIRRSVCVVDFFCIVLVLLSIAVYLYVWKFMEAGSVPESVTWPTGVIPETNFTHGDIYPTLCAKNYHGYSIVEIIGTTFGVYDKFRDPTKFYAISEHLYPGWDYNASAEGFEFTVLGERIPVVLYHFDNLTVWSFRGFASGVELATIMELFCSEYVLPLLQSFTLFGEYIVDWSLHIWMQYAYGLGVYLFSPETTLDLMVKNVLAEYEKHNYSVTDNVVFAGVNTGGVVAKILGMKTGRLGFSFLALNTFTDLLQFMNLNEDESWLIINLFHRGGWFSAQEKGLANNIVLPSVIDTILKDDKRPTFCTMALSCESHLQYEEFCRQMMGDEFVEDVHRYLKGLLAEVE